MRRILFGAEEWKWDVDLFVTDRILHRNGGQPIMSFLLVGCACRTNFNAVKECLRHDSAL